MQKQEQKGGEARQLFFLQFFFVVVDGSGSGYERVLFLLVRQLLGASIGSLLKDVSDLLVCRLDPTAVRNVLSTQ